MKNAEPILPSMELFGALSDEMRLKIMMVLDKSEFTVNEIKDILGIHQSNASRHLSKLHSCKLLKDRRENTKAYYGLSDNLYLSANLLETIRNAYAQLPDLPLLESRVKEVLNERRQNNARKFHKLDEAGGSFRAQISLFSKLIERFEVAVDIGCGEGADLSLMLSERCKKVVPVDIQPETIIGLEKILEEKGLENVKPLCADMSELPLPEDYADLVLMSQVLHHAPSPANALKEAVRILKPGGTLALLDLAEHGEEELRETYGHIWLGFNRERIEFFLQDLPCRIESFDIVPNESPTFKALPAICLIVRKNG